MARRIGLALALLVGLAVALLATDYGLACQRLQRTVDAAAGAGVKATARGDDVERNIRQRLARDGLGAGGDQVTIDRPRLDGDYAVLLHPIRVRLVTVWRSSLLPRFLHAPLELRATAAMLPPEMAAAQGHARVRIE